MSRKMKDTHWHWRRTSTGVYSFGRYVSDYNREWIQKAKVVRGADRHWWGWYKSKIYQGLADRIYGRFGSLTQAKHVIEFQLVHSKKGDG